MTDPRRRLPSVDSLLADPEIAGLASRHPRGVVVRAVRAAVDEARAEGGSAPDRGWAAAVTAQLARVATPSLVPVINATGVVLHTNLGRALLPRAAADAMVRVAQSYASVEYDLGRGARGSRHAICRDVLVELTGAADALVVNNAAAALVLALSALARDGEAVVSRGELVEIGGAFRVPDILARSGARLVEVGTTNRTRLSDYAGAQGERTGAILRAHPSNFRTLGFTEEVEIEALCGLGVPVVDDVGSGVLADDLELLAEEPAVRRSVRAGAALVCFSGDKLLGGPQAGVLVGTSEAVEACRRHPLARAVRLDKLSLAALEATLALYRDPELARAELPVLAMLDADPAALEARAERLAAGCGGEVVASTAKVGGGALPLLELPGPAVAIDVALAGPLRAGEPPVVGRIADGRLLLDVRTLTDEEADLAAAAVRAARAWHR
jgi:L-seryl-tRNA(Ser) seleniumtransferase